MYILISELGLLAVDFILGNQRKITTVGITFPFLLAHSTNAPFALKKKIQ